MLDAELKPTPIEEAFIQCTRWRKKRATLWLYNVLDYVPNKYSILLSFRFFWPNCWTKWMDWFENNRIRDGFMLWFKREFCDYLLWYSVQCIFLFKLFTDLRIIQCLMYKMELTICRNARNTCCINTKYYPTTLQVL